MDHTGNPMTHSAASVSQTSGTSQVDSGAIPAGLSTSSTQAPDSRDDFDLSGPAEPYSFPSAFQNADLSRPSPYEILARDDLNFKQQAVQYQRNQQKTVLTLTLFLISFLYLTAIVFSAVLVHLSYLDHSFDWHSWLLGSALLVPPTILGVALIRAVYPKHHDKDSDLDSVPATKTIVDFIKALKE